MEESSMSGVAVVTGGTRGIGHAIALELKEAGFKIAAIYHGNEEAAKAFEKETKCKAYKCDVADYEACEKAIQKIEKDLGPVTVLVNNAGITRDGVLHKMDPKLWHEVIETNLSSCF